MNQKLFFLLVLIQIFLKVTSNQIPVFKCIQDNNWCIFKNVVLNASNNYEWQPTADNPRSFGVVAFQPAFQGEGSIVPVLSNVICVTFPQLRQIQVSGVSLEVVHEDAFDACPYLEILDLSSNFIKELSNNTFSALKNLKYLYILSNEIKTLDPTIFLPLPNLETVSIDNNELEDFSPELFKNNPKIWSLSVTSNNLADVEVEKFVASLPRLKYFYLLENEISCTRTVKIYNFLNTTNIEYFMYQFYGTKTRYYKRNVVSRGITCNPDVSWMASNYRKKHHELAKLGVIEKKLDALSGNYDKLLVKLGRMIDFMSELKEK